MNLVGLYVLATSGSFIHNVQLASEGVVYDISMTQPTIQVMLLSYILYTVKHKSVSWKMSKKMSKMYTFGFQQTLILCISVKLTRDITPIKMLVKMNKFIY